MVKVFLTIYPPAQPGDIPVQTVACIPSRPRVWVPPCVNMLLLVHCRGRRMTH